MSDLQSRFGNVNRDEDEGAGESSVFDSPTPPTSQSGGGLQDRFGIGAGSAAAAAFDPSLPSADVIEPSAIRQDPRFAELQTILFQQEDFRGRSPIHPVLDLLSRERDRRKGYFNETLRLLSEEYGLSESEIRDQVTRSLVESGMVDTNNRDWVDHATNFLGEQWLPGVQQIGRTPIVPTHGIEEADPVTIGDAAVPAGLYIGNLLDASQNVLFSAIGETQEQQIARLTGEEPENQGATLRSLGSAVGSIIGRPVEFEIEGRGRDLWRNFFEITTETVNQTTGRELDPDTLFGDEVVTEDVYQYLGIGTDLLVAPDTIGMWARAGGRSLRTLGAGKAGDALTRTGNAIDNLPGISIGSTYRTIPEGARRAAENFLSDRFINPALNMRIPGYRGGPSSALGEWITPYGRNPQRPNLGATDVDEAGRTGAGLSPRIVESQRAGALARERTLGQVNQSFEQIQEIFGEPIARGWVDSAIQTARRYGQGVHKHVGKYELNQQQVINALATDVADSTGLIQRPGAIERLDNVFTRTEDANVLAPTAGQEFENLRTVFDQQATDDAARLSRAQRGSSAGMFRQLQNNPAFDKVTLTDNGSGIVIERQGATITLSRNADGSVSTDGLTRGAAGSGSALKRMVLDAADESGVTMTASNAPTPRAGEASDAFDFDARREANAERLRGEGYSPREDGTFTRPPAMPAIRGTPLTGSLVEKEARVRLRGLATEWGVDPDELLRDFDEIVDITVAADAAMGFQYSLYPQVKQSFFREVMTRGGDHQTAAALWRRMYQEAGQQTPRQQRGLLPDEPPEQPAIYQISELDGTPLEELLPGVKTTGDLFDGTRLATNLDISDWMQASSQGHLRRVYGFFQNDREFRRYIDSFNEGRSLPGHMLTDSLDEAGNTVPGGITRVQSSLVEGGWDEALAGRMGDGMREYIEQIAPGIPSSRGAVIRYDALATHLQGRGFSPEQVSEGLNSLVRGMQGELGEQAQRLTEFGERIQADDALWNRPFAPMAEVAERANLEVSQLEELGQLADVRVSLLEQLGPNARGIDRATTMAGIYRYAKETGLIIEGGRPSNDVIQNFRLTSDSRISESALGPFASSQGRQVWVNRTLYQQLEGLATADDATRAGAFQHLMGVVRAGYLANPRTTNVNTAGGLWQGAMMGLNPFDHASASLRFLRDWNKHGEDLPALRELGDIINTGAAHHAIVNNIEVSKLDAIGLTRRGGVRDVVTDLSRIYRELLDAPAGKFRSERGAANMYNRASSYLGLEGFQTSEVALKGGAYYLARAQGKTVEQAREIARQVVFDYSSAPKSVDFMRQTGIVAFPGFSYFLIPRMVDAYINRPGVMRIAENLDDAIWNAHFAAGDDEEDLKIMLQRGMPEHLRENRGTPLWRTGPDSMAVSSFDWMATRFNSTILGHLATGGAEGMLQMPLIDAAVSVGRAGEAIAGSRFGRRVFDPTAGGAERIGQLGNFLYNSYGPGLAKILFRPASDPTDPLAGPEGIIPAIMNSIRSVPSSVAGSGYSVAEFMEGGPDRALWMELAEGLIRTPTEVSVDPVLDSLNRQYEIEEREMQDLLGILGERADAYILKAYDDEATDQQRQAAMSEAERLMDRMTRMEERFMQEWMPITRAMARYYAQQGRQNVSESENSGGNVLAPEGRPLPNFQQEP